MTASEAARYLNQSATLTIGELSFPVTVTDAKTSYGRTRFLVTPVNGSGEQWVQFDSGRLLFDKVLSMSIR